MSNDTLSPNPLACTSSTVHFADDTFLTNSNYREEAKQILNEHFIACHDIIKKAGVEPPKLPELDDKTVSGLAASILWRHRWLLSFNSSDSKLKMLHIPTDAYVITSQEIKKNIGLILPGYRLIDRELYDRLTAKIEGKPLLDIDFSHQISKGVDLEDEFLCTLTCLQEELTGIFGALIHLLKTAEENKLGAGIAVCFAQELKRFGSLLAGDWEDSLIEKLKASHAELEKMNNVLDECLDESKNDQFGFNLVLTVHKRIQDIGAVIDVYCQQSKKAEVTEQAEEPAMDSGIEGGAE